MSKMVMHGSPFEVGAQTWEKLVLPCLKAAGGRPPKELAQFYSGLLCAAFGAMTADFGHEQAQALLQALVEQHAGMADQFEGARTQ